MAGEQGLLGGGTPVSQNINTGAYQVGATDWNSMVNQNKASTGLGFVTPTAGGGFGGFANLLSDIASGLESVQNISRNLSNPTTSNSKTTQVVENVITIGTSLAGLLKSFGVLKNDDKGTLDVNNIDKERFKILAEQGYFNGKSESDALLKLIESGVFSRVLSQSQMGIPPQAIMLPQINTNPQPQTTVPPPSNSAFTGLDLSNPTTQIILVILVMGLFYLLSRNSTPAMAQQPNSFNSNQQKNR
jgi:hypothetical protein